LFHTGSLSTVVCLQSWVRLALNTLVSLEAAALNAPLLAEHRPAYPNRAICGRFTAALTSEASLTLGEFFLTLKRCLAVLTAAQERLVEAWVPKFAAPVLWGHFCHLNAWLSLRHSDRHGKLLLLGT
jgi:hypothetical protein